MAFPSAEIRAGAQITVRDLSAVIQDVDRFRPTIPTKRSINMVGLLIDDPRAALWRAHIGATAQIEA